MLAWIWRNTRSLALVPHTRMPIPMASPPPTLVSLSSGQCYTFHLLALPNRHIDGGAGLANGRPMQ